MKSACVGVLSISACSWLYYKDTTDGRICRRNLLILRSCDRAS